MSSDLGIFSCKTVEKKGRNGNVGWEGREVVGDEAEREGKGKIEERAGGSDFERRVERQASYRCDDTTHQGERSYSRQRIQP